MGIEQQREIPFKEAVADWYDSVYLQVVGHIREWGILRDFPNRTEADLYLWIAEHRASLESELGWEIRPEAVIRDLDEQFGAGEARRFAWFGEILQDVLPVDKFQSGPPAGQWREETLAFHRAEQRLISEILVPVNGAENGWYALEQAFVIARKEGAHLHGLHLVSDETQRDNVVARAVQVEFERRCAEAGLSGHLVVAVGEIAPEICKRARWTDLIVTNLAFPPPPQPLARLDSGFRDLIQRCPRPILATPQTVTPLDKALLAYDGSPKSQEALFVATYLAGRWKTSLVVVSVINDGQVSDQTLAHAQEYLASHGVRCNCISASGPVAETILNFADHYDCNLILMGGYGYNPVLEVVLGSAVDQVLREAHRPVLICR
jgi:nucleotide-binding universal stress UspA family protein